MAHLSDTPISDMSETRTERLRTLTRTAHERLDQRIRGAAPFASRTRYAAFLAMQYRLHRDAAPLYDRTELQACFPGLAACNRLALIERDLQDLGSRAPDEGVPAAAAVADLPSALGWLYVLEGSNLGAAFLLKWVAPLGLHAGFGARHLAPAPDGRAEKWRHFTARLDAVELDGAAETRVGQGALAAFARACELAECLPPVGDPGT